MGSEAAGVQTPIRLRSADGSLTVTVMMGVRRLKCLSCSARAILSFCKKCLCCKIC